MPGRHAEILQHHDRMRGIGSAISTHRLGREGVGDAVVAPRGRDQFSCSDPRPVSRFATPDRRRDVDARCTERSRQRRRATRATVAEKTGSASVRRPARAWSEAAADVAQPQTISASANAPTTVGPRQGARLSVRATRQLRDSGDDLWPRLLRQVMAHP
jgi:hypothetical protein